MHTPLDLWIFATPEGRNDKCPCGCGMKWKKVIASTEEYSKHEKAFIEKQERQS